MPIHHQLSFPCSILTNPIDAFVSSRSPQTLAFCRWQKSRVNKYDLLVLLSNYLCFENIKMKSVRVILGVLCVAILTMMGAKAADGECIQICGCPDVSACPNRCGTLELGKCEPMYQCFLPANGLFAYVLAEGTFDGNITINVYDDPDCTLLRFVDPSSVGFEGSCDDECWGPDTSKVGARACDVECSPSKSSPGIVTEGKLLFVMLSTAIVMLFLWRL
jgi:hypothetical protein